GRGGEARVPAGGLAGRSPGPGPGRRGGPPASPPPPPPAAAPPPQPADRSRAGAPKGILGLAAEISRLATLQANAPAGGAAKNAIKSDAAAAAADPGDLALPGSALPERVVLGAGEPEAPISARPDG